MQHTQLPDVTPLNPGAGQPAGSHCSLPHCTLTAAPTDSALLRGTGGTSSTDMGAEVGCNLQENWKGFANTKGLQRPCKPSFS